MVLILNLFVFATAGVVGYVFFRSYRNAVGSWRERTFAAAKDSATLLWSYSVIAGTALINGAAALASVIDDTLAEKIKSVVPSEYVAAVVVFIMVGTILARLRSMFSA
jgi:hypothetical protein